MRIAYVAPYQGPGLRQRRPIVANLALAANLKIELLAELLRSKKHDVEILSQGEADERAFRLHPAFLEELPSASAVTARYCSALPVRFVSGFWSTWTLVQLLRKRHQAAPFDLAIVYNLQEPQAVAALYAIRNLGIPVILEYEDDSLVEEDGRTRRGLRRTIDRRLIKRALGAVDASIGVSPHLLSQAPPSAPALLLRGVISPEVLSAADDVSCPRHNWVVFSGTHSWEKGLPQLIDAWKLARPAGWQLHIAGYGAMTRQMEESAAGNETIVFHGLIDRQQNARLLRQSKIGINPHELSHVPGNKFAFKIIECLAAGTHVVTTPMGALEAELEAGVTYIPDNKPETIAAGLLRVIQENAFRRNAAEAARRLYGPPAVSAALDELIRQVGSCRRRMARSLTAADLPVNMGDPHN